MKLFFDMQIVDEYGQVHGRIRYEISPEAAYMGTRAVSEMKAGLGSFDDVIRMMKVREMRKDLLTQAGGSGGAALAQHLADREGWNDRSRQETIEAQYPKMAF